MPREHLYTCRCMSSEGEMVTHVLAWGEEEAAETARAELAAEDIVATGEIEVVAGMGGDADARARR